LYGFDKSGLPAIGAGAMLFDLIRPGLFLLDPERAHRLTIAALRASPSGAPPRPGALATSVAGLAFANPLGMAPGFDKDAEVPDAVLGLGFGEDRAVINRMGFNNSGLEQARTRLAARLRSGVVGANVGANKDASDRIADYLAGIRAFAPLADYITVNISSPNTPGLRDLQGDRELGELLGAIAANREAGDPPVFLKVAPDLDAEAPGRIVEAVVRHGLAGIIVSNTTITRPPLKSRYAGEAGGLSGAPLRDLAQQRLRDFHAVSQGTVPLIGVGGIASAEDAWARIRAGASLVQLYSAMVYEGPGIARRILRGLEALMRRDGFATIAAAVGSE
jgi:dihydroorotate dehydrogenase